jgi:hypothetical protein
VAQQPARRDGSPGSRRFGWSDDDLGPDLTQGAGMPPAAGTPVAQQPARRDDSPGSRRFGWSDDDLGPDLTQGAAAADPDDDDLSDLAPIPPDPDIEALMRELFGEPASGPVIEEVADPRATTGLVQAAIHEAISALAARHPVGFGDPARTAAIRIAAQTTDRCEIAVYEGFAVVEWPTLVLAVPYSITQRAAVIAPFEQWQPIDGR